MSSRDPERRREVNRSFYRFARGLAVDAALEAAQLLLDPKKPCIAYYRVYHSEKPPHPDYEAEAQRRAVKRVVDGAGATLVDAYTEQERRGRRQRKRHQLDAALARCEALGATLIIAKLGHLAASAPILSQLTASGVDFVACDKTVNHRTIEAVAIAVQRKEKPRTERIRARWAALKEAGYRPVHATSESTRQATEAVRLQSRLFAADIAPYLEAARRQGCRSSREIAAAFNAAGLKTRRGCRWRGDTVLRALRRAAGLTPSPHQIAAAEAALDAKIDSLSAAIATPAAQRTPAASATAQPPKKKRGPAPVLRQTIVARMRAHISQGMLTAEQLAGLDDEALAAEYGASRHTVRDARKEALSL